MTLLVAGPCVAEGCKCREWEYDPDGTVRHGGADGEPMCKGPVVFGSNFITFKYTRLCNCPSMATDGLCWGCYLETK